MAKALRFIARKNQILIHGDVVCVRVKTMAVRVDICDRHDLPDILAAEVFAVGAVAGGAILLVDRRALRRQVLVDRKRIGHSRETAQPIGDALQALPVAGRGRDAGAHGRAAIALFQRNVVAVPMQIHFESLALALIPDRREIGGADPLFLRKLIGWEVEICFQRIKRVDAPRPPLGLFGDKTQAVAQR